MRTSVFLALVAALCAPLAAAADQNYFTDRWRLSLSAYWQEVDSTVRVDPDLGQDGTNIALEKDLGFDDHETVPRLDLRWRITPRHKLELGYFGLSRSGSRRIDRTIVFDDQTFPINASVSGEFDLDFLRLTYGWSFHNSGRSELGLSVGAYGVKLDAELRGNVGGVGEAVEREDATVGFPIVGVYGGVELLPRLVLDGRLQYLQLDISDFDIRVTELSIALDYAIVDHVSLNVGYSYLNVDVESDRGDFNGSIDMDITGPTVGLSVAF